MKVLARYTVFARAGIRLNRESGEETYQEMDTSSPLARASRLNGGSEPSSISGSYKRRQGKRERSRAGNREMDASRSLFCGRGRQREDGVVELSYPRWLISHP